MPAFDVLGSPLPRKGGVVRITRSSSNTSTLEWLPSVTTGAVRVVDCALLVAAAAAAHAFYYTGDSWSPEPWDFRLLVILAAVMQMNIFHFWGIYTFRRLADLQFQFASIPLATFVLFLSVVATLFLTKTSEDYSRGWMVIWSMATLGGLLSFRLLLCPLARRLLSRGYLAPRVAFVGRSQTADRLLNYLQDFPKGHFQFVGLFDDRNRDGESGSVLKPNGSIDELCELARQRDIDAIIITLPNITEERLEPILSKLRSLPIDVRLCTNTLEHCLPHASYELFGVIPLLRLYDKPVSRWGLLGKTIEDFCLASLLLPFVAPLMLAIAILIRLNSPGPALFKQKRYGFNNRLFTVWKFRTMFQQHEDADANQQTRRDDPRVTHIGRFLRATSLDELPQIFNVLNGDMSFVGPRPHAIGTKAEGQLFEKVVNEYAHRHRVKPGITGWAQVNGWRGETDTVEKIKQRVRYDLEYVDNWSLLFDLKILLMTCYVVLKRVNAY